MEVVKKNNKKALNLVAGFINRGGVVVCPTDTVYGFLALAENKKAVSKIYSLKQRKTSKPLPIFVNNIKNAKQIAEINPSQEKLLEKYWPGKYTVVVKRKKGIKLHDGGRETVALRVPKYLFLNKLLAVINKPLVQTSVNISDSPFLYKIKEIENQFGDKGVLIIDGGDLKKSKPSVILDLTKEKIKILRP